MRSPQPKLEEPSGLQRTAAFLSWSSIVLCGIVLCLVANTRLTLAEQVLFGAATLVIAAVSSIWPRGRLVTLGLVLLSCFTTLRYGLWRGRTVFDRLHDTHGAYGWIALGLACILLAAEALAAARFVLANLQSMWPLSRKPVALPHEVEQWPKVDLLICTQNESVQMAKFTALAALNLDWPVDKLKVYVLDKAQRRELELFCHEAGVEYRPLEAGASAGALEHVLTELSAPFLAVFEADHVPVRSFLQVTMGSFAHDPRLALVQTPQVFYAPDPFERNLHRSRVLPSSVELLSEVAQEGSDLWNAVALGRSGGVLRRRALDEIQGWAEHADLCDVQTTLELQARGWKTAFLNVPQAAGLASERLTHQVRQRVRWARKAVHLLRAQNTLWSAGLSVAQRLCFVSTVLQAVAGVPRLLFLVAPLAYLIFGLQILPGGWEALLAFGVPHLILAHATRARLQGPHRHRFWSELYETVLAPHLVWPSVSGFRRDGSETQVDADPHLVPDDRFDMGVAAPFVWILLANLIGLLFSVPRLVNVRLPFGTDGALRRLGHALHDVHAHSAAGMTWLYLGWTIFNIMVVTVAIGVTRESRQRRRTVRLSMAVPANVVLADGSNLSASTADLSRGGVLLQTKEIPNARAGDPVSVIFFALGEETSLPAIVVAVDGGGLRLCFDELTLDDEEALAVLLYSRADTWLRWWEQRSADSVLRTARKLAQLSGFGIAGALGRLLPLRRPTNWPRYTGLLLLALVLSQAIGDDRPAWAQEAGSEIHSSMVAVQEKPPKRPGVTGTPSSPPSRDVSRTLALSSMQPQASSVLLSQAVSSRTLSFDLGPSSVVRSAVLHMHYRLGPALLGRRRVLRVLLNGAVVAHLGAQPDASVAGEDESAVVALSPELLVQRNELVFALEGVPDSGCAGTDCASSTWVQVEPQTTITLRVTEMALAADLQRLPAPFVSVGSAPPPVTFLFVREPSREAWEAAGLLASWLGSVAGPRPVPINFMVGSAPPPGNTVALLEAVSPTSEQLGPWGVQPSSVSLRNNPGNAQGGTLVLAGRDGGDLVKVARDFVLRWRTLSGSAVAFGDAQETDAENRSPAAFVTGSPATNGLQAFASVGAPFTVTPELAGVDVVLGSRPGHGTLALYLAMMEQFGAWTGHAALGSRLLAQDAALRDLPAGDAVLTIATANAAPINATAQSPFLFERGRVQVRRHVRLADVVRGTWPEPLRLWAATLSLSGHSSQPAGALLQSGLLYGHPVVAVTLRTDQDGPSLARALSIAPVRQELAGSASVFISGHFQPMVGSESPPLLSWSLGSLFVTVFLLLAVLGLTLLSALAAHTLLAQQAKRRLGPGVSPII